MASSYCTQFSVLERELPEGVLFRRQDRLERLRVKQGCSNLRWYETIVVAEREGFEPSVEVLAPTTV
jgi:hypothetical protein